MAAYDGSFKFYMETSKQLEANRLELRTQLLYGLRPSGAWKPNGAAVGRVRSDSTFSMRAPVLSKPSQAWSRLEIWTRKDALNSRSGVVEEDQVSSNFFFYFVLHPSSWCSNLLIHHLGNKC